MSALAYVTEPAAFPAPAPLPAPLPLRPRLRDGIAVVWRDTGVLQLGLSGQVVVVEGVPRSAQRVASSLDGRRTVSELVDQEDPWVRSLVEVLDAEGLLADGPARQGDAGRARVVGSGSLAAGAAPLLVAAGAHTVLSDVPRGRRHRTSDVPPDIIGSGPIRSCVTLVAPETCEPDRVLTDRLVRGDTAHVVVRVHPGEAVVGPFVTPGGSSCLRCVDLVRSSLDPAWRRVALELSRQPAPHDPLLESWAASVAAAQVLAFLAGAAPELSGATLHLEKATGRTRLRRWPVHPRCGCREMT